MRSSPNSDTWGSLVVMVGLAVICFSGQLSGSGMVSATPSKSLLRMAAMTSGNFSNGEQVQNEIDNGQTPRSLFFFLSHPVRMSLFGQDNETFYVEGNFNGTVLRRLLLVSSEDHEGLIRFRSFKLKIPLPDGPWSVDISSLEGLTMDDLEYIEGCDTTYNEVDHEVYLGKFRECSVALPESNIYYPIVFTCDGFFDPTDLPTGGEVPTIVKPLKRFKLQTYSYEGESRNELCPGTYE